MRWLVILIGALVLCPQTVAAVKSLYVSGYREVSVRTAPNSDGTEMATLRTGDEVSLIGSSGDYYLVTLPGGSRGYVPKSVVTEQEPAEVRLQKLDQRTQQQIKELQAKTGEQEKLLAALRRERQVLEDARKQAESKASEQTRLASDLQTQQDTVERDSKIRWFLAGAGVLGIGFLFGWVGGALARRRNRQPGLSFGRSP